MKLDDWVYRGSHKYYDKALQNLANALPPEKWSYSGKSDFGIMRSYLANVFSKLYMEREEAPESEKQNFIYEDDIQACFNTGLYDKHLQPIFYYCVLNNIPGFQRWKFEMFYNSYTIRYTKMPSLAVSRLQRPNFFSDPSELIMDPRLDIIPQWEHILDDDENYNRIPEQLRVNGKDFCRNLIQSEIENVKKRIQANYKTVVPQWYKNKIQLLVPLYLTNGENPDLALVLSQSEDKTQYFGHTCLTMEMAYNNARLVARPDSYWLHP